MLYQMLNTIILGGILEEKIKEIFSNLHLNKIESRDKHDETVQNDVHDKEIFKVCVDFPVEFNEVLELLKKS